MTVETDSINGLAKPLGENVKIEGQITFQTKKETGAFLDRQFPRRVMKAEDTYDLPGDPFFESVIVRGNKVLWIVKPEADRGYKLVSPSVV